MTGFIIYSNSSREVNHVLGADMGMPGHSLSPSLNTFKSTQGQKLLVLLRHVKTCFVCVCVLSRPDVATTTPWLAPIVWERTFDLKIIDDMYKPQNITVATTVFALGKYVTTLGVFTLGIFALGVFILADYGDAVRLH